MKITIKLFDTDKETSPGSHLIIPRDVAVKAIDDSNSRIKTKVRSTEHLAMTKILEEFLIKL